MAKKLLVVVLVVGLGVAAWIALRGRHHAPTTTTSVTTTTTSAEATRPVQAYFYLGAALVPVVVQVPKTTAVASAAVRALVAGPPSGYTTAIPAGTKLDDLTIAAGTAHANFSRALTDAPRTAQGQIVYTLTQFPTVNGVVVDAGGSPVPLSNGAGKTLLAPATRDDYVDLTPTAPIFVTAPPRDSTVTSPLKVVGTASVFEGTIELDVQTDGKVVQTHSITASRGAPERGTFEQQLDLAPGKHELVFYEPSAENGSHLHTTTVDITVSP
jgi:germination protein M